jgi:hypothetical protein
LEEADLFGADTFDAAGRLSAVFGEDRVLGSGCIG